jgi:DNA-binding LacI/PurR family transcriptional regulator
MLASYLFHQQNAPADCARLSPLRLPVDTLRREEGLEQTRRWLDAERPDVVIVGSNLSAEALRRCGCRIPEDLYVINLRQSQYRHDLAGLTLDRVAVINTAIHHLHAIIQHGPEMQSTHQPTTVLNPIWQDGDSFPAMEDRENFGS